LPEKKRFVYLHSVLKEPFIKENNTRF